MTEAPVKFLLVDDIDDNLLALEALLRRDGLVCMKASSGREALELLLDHDFALALLDVQMPGMDGFELAELMRGAARTKHVPIIFVTAGNRDQGRLFKGYESGAVDFLYKPVEPRILQGKAEVFFELYRRRKEYAQILEMNEMFVGILSHDLRNPLGTVLTGAQLLGSELKDERQRKTLERMSAAGRRMAEMIEQLLDLTRARVLDGVGFASARQWVDVAALAQRALDELQGAYPERELRFRASGECATTGDPGRLLQLFSNLVGNAIRYGEPGTPITVDVSSDSTEVSVSIHNLGTIAPHAIPTLFDPFRDRSRRRTPSQGLGLGLYISQQIAVAHGGSIDVSSDLQTGSTFTVRIPRRPIGEKPPVGALAKTVLVVEDDKDTRDSLIEAFAERGYRTLAASNGREALDRLAERERPDLVVLDIGLPVLDGTHVYEAMRLDPALVQIPIVMSTADPAKAPAEVVVVPKPLKLDVLLAAVETLCPTH